MLRVDMVFMSILHCGAEKLGVTSGKKKGPGGPFRNDYIEPVKG